MIWERISGCRLEEEVGLGWMDAVKRLVAGECLSMFCLGNDAAGQCMP